MENFFDRNIEALAQTQPIVAANLRKTPQLESRQIGISPDGFPIPTLAGVPLHDTQQPLQSAITNAEQFVLGQKQNRIFILGFGFGYELFRLVELGYSPIVFEPNPQVISSAFHLIDFKAILPYVTIHVPPRLPDVPRWTKVVALPAYQELYPDMLKGFVERGTYDGPSTTHEPQFLLQGLFYTTHRNVAIIKNPCDLAAYRSIFSLVRPEILIEIGAYRGGSALYFADILKALHGEHDFVVHSMDIVDEFAPETVNHPNIRCYSNGWQNFDLGLIDPGKRVLVIEDSSHTYENTLQVLEHFAPLVSPNSYFIVEDGISTITHPELDGGPFLASEEFLRNHPEFEWDARWESMFGFNNSSCIRGFLRRKSELETAEQPR